MPLNFNDLRNRYRFVDGASGWNFDDHIRGSKRRALRPGGGEVAECLVLGMELTAAGGGEDRRGAWRSRSADPADGTGGFNKDLNDPPSR